MDLHHTFPCSHEVTSLCDNAGGDSLQFLDLEVEWLLYTNPGGARMVPMHGGDRWCLCMEETTGTVAYSPPVATFI